jgi:methylated-DNA-protein-cysteine methyltransferase related protein
MSFTEKVYEISKKIPKGRVATYSQIAALVGSPKASRAVGCAMKNNPHMPIVPCHRVVSSTGKLTGYSAGGISVKKAMLLEEGVYFVGDKVDLSKSQWRKIAS